jgi:Flp pilus assembly protein TadD
VIAAPIPKSFFHACAALERGDREGAQTNFERTLSAFETAVQQAPDNGLRHANLGLLYAFLERKEEAIREGRRATELEPDSKDAVNAPWRPKSMIRSKDFSYNDIVTILS